MLRSAIALVTTDGLGAALTEFLDCCMSRNLSPHTIGYYRDRISAFRKYCRTQHQIEAADQITAAHIRGYISHSLGAGYSAKTVNHTVKAVKALLNFLVEEGRLPVSPAARIKPIRMEKRIIETLSQQQVEQMLARCDLKTYLGVRDHAIVLTLLDTGLRVSELCGLSLTDVDLSAGLIRAIGKGNKERVVPFGKSLRRALHGYLGRRGEIEAEDRFFLNQFAEPINRRTVLTILSRLGQRAGVTGVRVSPHTFRHTFAKNWILNGGDPFSLQRILGHTTQQMVSEYVNLAASDLQSQHAKFSPVDRLKNPQPAKTARLK